MRGQRLGKLCAAAAFAGCAGVVGVALAADLPFWGAGSSMPTREPVSRQVSAAAAPLDSRAVQTVESAAVAFNSDAVAGLAIFVR